VVNASNEPIENQWNNIASEHTTVLALAFSCCETNIRIKEIGNVVGNTAIAGQRRTIEITIPMKIAWECKELEEKSVQTCSQ
jgi:hypothetical protein